MSCDGAHVLQPDSTCLMTIQPGYVNISNVAVACTGDCATCSVFTYNCTACKNNKHLDGNNCVGSCPAGQVS